MKLEAMRMIFSINFDVQTLLFCFSSVFEFLRNSTNHASLFVPTKVLRTEIFLSHYVVD